MSRRHPVPPSRAIRTAARIASSAAAALVLLLAAAPVVRGVAEQAPLTDSSVELSIVRVTPSTPAASDEPHDLDITISLANTTDQALNEVTIQGVRATPIDGQKSLDAAIARPQPPDPSLSVAIVTRDKKPVTTALGPRASSEVVYRTSTEIPFDEAHLCLCHDAIYPLYFSAHTTDASGADIQVGSTQTYIPSFSQPDELHPVQVSWVWPILDHPHRLLGEKLFTDDDLAASVQGGRLDRVLQVLTGVAGKLPITVVMDPEIMDELAIMSEGAYQVDSGHGGAPKAGVGTDAAKAWLERLRGALAEPDVQVSFTPFADPDTESLTLAGLTWTTSLGQAAKTRISTALGGIDPTADVAWPVGEAASQNTIDALARQGATSMILSDHALPPVQVEPAENGLGTLQSAAGPVSALVTSATVQRYVAPVLTLRGQGATQLPLLVAEVAIRAVEAHDTGTYLPIVAPRLIDPSPAIAVRAILATGHAYWSTGSTIDTAVRTVVAANHGALVPPNLTSGGLSGTTIAVAQAVSHEIPALTTMLSSTDADQLLGAYPAAVQRIESSAWRDAPEAGDALARQMASKIDQLEAGVRIVKPSSGNGTYTLASSNSPLPITVENRLNVTVTVRIRVESVNRLPGFVARDIGRQRIAPNSKVTLHIPTKVERTGRFQVEAVLLSPSDDVIGTPVILSVHSTALGTIGVIITAVAGGILFLALVVRAVRRLRRRRRSGTPPPPLPRVPEPV